MTGPRAVPRPPTDLRVVAFAPRGSGGQRHLLPGVLFALDLDDEKKLREILAADPDSVNWPGLADAMAERGYVHSVSTFKRWGRDYRRDPGRFGG